MSYYWIAANILFSAITYLSDFISNILVTVDYGTRYTKLLRESPAECNSDCRYSKKIAGGYFWALLLILLLAHTVNALIFKFKYPQDDPFRSAYFLPLIHLCKMVDVLRRTFSFEKLKELRAPKHVNGLFAILGAAIEGMPILVIQFTAFHFFSSTSKGPLLIASIVTSFVAAGYTGGFSTLTLADNAQSTKEKLGIGISSGLFAVLASLARCVSFTMVIVYLPKYYFHIKPLGFRIPFQGCVFAAGITMSYWLYYWILQHPKELLKSGDLLNPKRCLTCFLLGYMSLLTGPIYPMVSEARDKGELGTYIFEIKLFVLSFVNIGADMAVILTSYRLGTLPNAYMLGVSVGAGLGYLVFLLIYIAVDIHCGPIKDSSSQRKPPEVFYDAEQSDDSKYFDTLSTME